MCVWTDTCLHFLYVRLQIFASPGCDFFYFLLFFFSVQTFSRQRRQSFSLFYLTLFEIQVKSSSSGGSGIAPDMLTSLSMKFGEP